MDIGIWGDSITYGGPNEGWVAPLRKVLSSRDINVYNRGICGDTSEDILKRFTVEKDAIEPAIIIFAVGTNDSKYPNGGKDNKISFEKFKENMRKLIAQAKSSANRVLLIGLTPVNETTIDSTSKFLNSSIKQYDEYLKQLAEQEGLEFIEINSVLDLKTDLEDGIHPNAQGYAKMFKAVLSVFK